MQTKAGSNDRLFLFNYFRITLNKLRLGLFIFPKIIMRTIVIIGGSSVVAQKFIRQITDFEINFVLFSRSENIFPDRSNVQWHQFDILSEEFRPEHIPASVEALVYFPGTIQLKPLTTLQITDFQQDFEINFLGAVKAIKAFYCSLRKSGNGSIVLFSTVAAKLGMPFHASVASVKAAVEGLTRSLAAEFAPYIRVNCIAPSLTETQMAAKLLANEERRNAIAARNPMKRIGKPEDLASLVEFLAGDKSNWITGQIIAADGGMSTLNLS